MKGIITTVLCLAVILATPSLSPAVDLILVKGGKFMMGSPDLCRLERRTYP